MAARGLVGLAAELRDMGKHITIETAGTLAPEGIACDLASISPKLSHSTPKPGEISAEWIARHEAARLRPDVIRAWVEQYPFQMKFVVAGETDLAEIDSVLQEIEVEVSPEKVLLMPEGRSVQEIAERAPAVVEICKRRGFRYCDRLHITLFANRRGT